MRKIACVTAIAMLSMTVPAHAAGEGRVEARGGIAFVKGASEAFLGGAAGYDFDLGDKAFIGVEGSAEKILQDGSDLLFGLGARIGVKAGEKARLYAIGGYGFSNGAEEPFLGAGAQINFGAKAFGKIEYRRIVINNSPDLNFAGVGFGVRF